MTDINNIDLSDEGIERSRRPFEEALRSMEGGRWYAIEDGDLAPIAFWIGFCENQDTSPSTREVGEYLKKRVAHFSEGLFQYREGAEPRPPSLPQVNGIEVANAFLFDDRESQNLWLRLDPENALFWKEAALRGGGKPTIAQMVAYEKLDPTISHNFRAIARCNGMRDLFPAQHIQGDTVQTHSYNGATQKPLACQWSKNIPKVHLSYLPGGARVR